MRALPGRSVVHPKISSAVLPGLDPLAGDALGLDPRLEPIARGPDLGVLDEGR